MPNVLRYIASVLNKRLANYRPLKSPGLTFLSGGEVCYNFQPATFGSILPETKSTLERFAKEWVMTQFVAVFHGRAAIEPSFGWLVDGSGRIIPESRLGYFELKSHHPTILQNSLRAKQNFYFPSVISLGYGWQNYWHFHNDILGPLKMIEDAGVPKETPIVVPAALQHRQYFRGMLASSKNLRNRNWVFQEKTHWITTDECFVSAAGYGHQYVYDATLSYLDYEHRPSIASSSVQPKIFVDRHPSRGRALMNRDNVVLLAQSLGFTVLDCDNMSFAEQREVFSSARVVCGIHGAGLTNTIYRRGQKTAVFEIFPENYINPCYFWLCQQYGYEYSALACPVDERGNLQIDLDIFKNFLSKL